LRFLERAFDRVASELVQRDVLARDRILPRRASQLDDVADQIRHLLELLGQVRNQPLALRGVDLLGAPEGLERRGREPGVLTVEHEALDVGREIGMGLEAVTAGHPHQHEPALVALVLGGAIVAVVALKASASSHDITPIPARHTVPAVGYHLDSGNASLVFTGDTGPNDALWRVVNRIRNLKFLIIETAFSNKERHLAEISRHLCPQTLAEELAKLERNAEIFITHMKPGEIEPTMQEIEECAGAFRPRMLQNNLVLEF